MKRLGELVDQSDSVCICIDDSELLSFTLPSIIKELKNSGVKQDKITILLASGINENIGLEKSVHELLSRNDLGDIDVSNHKCNADNLTYVGSTSFGNKIHLNKRLIDSSFKIIIGQIQPHYMAGYSGKETIILPGLAGMKTILFNSKMSLNPDSKPGILKGNPVHEDSNEAMDLAKVDFCINVILDTDMNFFNAFMGAPDDVPNKITTYVENIYNVEIESAPEVIIASPGGNFFDNDLYKACDVLYNIQKILQKESILILISECLNGYGNVAFCEFMQWSKNAKNKDIIKKARNNFKLGYEKALFLSEVIQKNKVLLVSVMPDYYVKNVFGLRPSETTNDALKIAKRIVGNEFNGIVIPYGSLTIPSIKR